MDYYIFPGRLMVDHQFLVLIVRVRFLPGKLNVYGNDRSLSHELEIATQVVVLNNSDCHCNETA